MKATELRIGNLVYDGGSITQLSLADFYNMYLDDKCEFKPITLTEEWLVKFGQMWGNSDNGRYRMYYNLEDNHLYDYDNFANCNKISWIKIKYVHQLQNIYFALTGEELTIK